MNYMSNLWLMKYFLKAPMKLPKQIWLPKPILLFYLHYLQTRLYITIATDLHSPSFPIIMVIETPLIITLVLKVLLKYMGTVTTLLIIVAIDTLCLLFHVYLFTTTAIHNQWFITHLFHLFLYSSNIA